MTQADKGAPAAKVAVAGATIYYDKLYTYLLPDGLRERVFAGSMVLVPFGRGTARPRVGVVVEVYGEQAPSPRLKSVLDAAPEDARLTDELLAIVKYLKEATFCTWFDAVKAVIPYGAQYKMVREGDGWRLKKQMERYTETVYSLAKAWDNTATDGSGSSEKPKPRRLTEKQQKVLELLAAGPMTRAEICGACGVTPAVPDNLAAKGYLEKGSEDKPWDEDANRAGAAEAQTVTDELSPAQRQVADELLARMAEEKPRPALLHGVTGSGKTAVIIELLRHVLAQGKTALVLVPEIGLTPQMISQLKRAFGGRVAVQHSALNATERLLQWRAIQRGAADVVVGTRSAVFAPLENIGAIVIDEEQERTYQSESAPRYDAIDVAKRRAARHGALLMLASATPGVASYHYAKAGRYSLHTLSERYGSIPLPSVELIDMRAELMDGNPGVLSRALAGGMEEAIAAGGQVILLLNRRGYHRVAVCAECGAAVKCDDCSVPMVYHKNRRGKAGGAGDAAAAGMPAGAFAAEDSLPAQGCLVCHYCGKSKAPAPEVCPECGGQLRYLGFGTQRLEDELAQRLPNARVLRMDMDTTGQKGAHAAMLGRFAAGQYDILLGTQMVAKGLDFERVRLVGVVGIDSLLFSQGYRAYETVFSLVTQVVGRSGRSGSQGTAMIQTMDPQNPVLNLAARQDYEEFFAEENGFRKLALYPPYCTLCMAGFVSESELGALKAARRFAELLSGHAKAHPGIPLRVLGPAPMQVMQVAGSFRYRLTIKCRADAAFRALARQVLDDYNKEGWPRTASVYLDFHADG